MDAEEQQGQPIVSNGLPLTSLLRSQRLCRHCDIPRLPGRRLTGCAIAEMERADAYPPGAPPRPAQLPKTPKSAPGCRLGSTEFQRRAAPTTVWCMRRSLSLKFRFPRRITAVSPDTAVNCSLAAH